MEVNMLFHDFLRHSSLRSSFRIIEANYGQHLSFDCSGRMVWYVYHRDCLNGLIEAGLLPGSMELIGLVVPLLSSLLLYANQSTL